MRATLTLMNCKQNMCVCMCYVLHTHTRTHAHTYAYYVETYIATYVHTYIHTYNHTWKSRLTILTISSSSSLSNVGLVVSDDLLVNFNLLSSLSLSSLSLSSSPPSVGEHSYSSVCCELQCISTWSIYVHVYVCCELRTVRKYMEYVCMYMYAVSYSV